MSKSTKSFSKQIIITFYRKKKTLRKFGVDLNQKNRTMKKKLLILGLSLGICAYTIAQVNPHAIGIRGGGSNFGNGAEISYQHGFGDANRLELDLGWRGRNDNSSMGITGIYHWVWNITSGLNWYVGPGAQIGLYQDKWDNNNDGINLAIGGQLGLEFDFNELGAPLLLSLDTRPMWGFNYGNNGWGYGGSLGLRYTF